jgi:hypothetical protein
MSAEENSSAPTQKPGCAVRAFLIVLPVGLAFMVPLSLWIYYQKKHRPAPATSQYAALLRKDLNAADFERYVRILTQDIGERSLGKRENLDAATAFIESTMGYDNMGYAVQRQVFEIQGQPAVNIVAELPGQSKPREVVLVIANYDDANATGIAALMCVAHALTGSEHARTIMFAAVMDEAGGRSKLKMAEDGKAQEFRAVVQITAKVPDSVEGEWGQAMLRPFLLTPSDASNRVLERLRELQSLLETSADVR